MTNRAKAPHQNGRNFVNELALASDMFGFFGKAIDMKEGGYYGLGILSRWPAIEVKTSRLPHPVAEHETRIVLEGVFEVGRDTLCFASTHLDFNLASTNAAQCRYISRHFEGSSYPVILGGDFNAKPESESISKIMEGSWFSMPDAGQTYPSRDRSARIDYLFAHPMKGWRVVHTQVIRSAQSDHYPVIADLEYIF